MSNLKWVFCRYVVGDFSIDETYFHSLPKDKKEKILDYKLMIYICEGQESEKLDWFETINIAGEKLTPQELKNAVFTGNWLTSAKSIFSKSGCAAYGLAKDYVSGTPIRQEFLETAIAWISKDNIRDYMSKHQNDANANELWTYFKNVIDWVKLTFPHYRKEMKGLKWNLLYNEFHNQVLDSNKLENAIKQLMTDDDVTNKKGIYFYVLNNDEKHLNIRAFTDNQKRTSYEKQNGICTHCKKHFELNQMEGDHIIPWHLGGKTSAENCQMLCQNCNRRKSGK